MTTLPPGYTLVRQDEDAPAGRPPQGSVWAIGPGGIATTVYTTEADAIAAAWALDAHWAAMLAQARRKEAVMNEQEPMAYVAIAPCGCTKYAGVDTPTIAKENARELAWAVKQGYTIERVTCAWVRENWRSDCDICRKPKKRAKRASTGQMELAL